MPDGGSGLTQGGGWVQLPQFLSFDPFLGLTRGQRPCMTRDPHGIPPSPLGLGGTPPVGPPHPGMSEVVVAVQEGSRGELHPPGQLRQPPDEAGMWWEWGPPKAGPHACWSWGLRPRLLHPAQPCSGPWGGWLGGLARPRHCVTSSQAEPTDPMTGPALRDLIRKSRSQESLGSPG